MIGGIRRGRALRIALALAAGAVLLTCLMVVISGEVRFLIRAAFEEGRILLRRRPLTELIADTTTAADRRAMFRLVLEARDFASDVLGLDAADTYTTFSDVGRDTLLLVLSASPSDALQPYVWRYPIVGAVAYKGYFDPEEARRAERKLQARGYDTYLRPAGAFSTLGWFSDPLLSTALSGDSVSVATTVIHEITHNTLYIPGATAFNESLAAFVGYRGAEALFQSLGDTVQASRASKRWQDELLLADLYAWLSQSLESQYAKRGDDAAVIRAKDSIISLARDRLATSLGGRLAVYDGERMARRPMNNASVIAARLYRTHLDWFDDLLELLHGDLAKTVSELVAAPALEPDPFAALEAMLRPRPDQ